MEIMRGLKNEVDNQIEENLEIKQNKFLETNIGKIVNTAVNVGLRFVLPDLIEDEIIEVKDTILEEGFKEGLDKAIEKGINFGKSTLGILTGKFEDINQMKNVVKKGGIIDNISKLLDTVVTKGNSNGKISNNTANMIKKGKNIILDNISSNIESMMTDQVYLVEKLNKYSKQWNKHFNNKDFYEMEKVYQKINNILERIAPLEQIITDGRRIENLHKLIKNNGRNFNITEDELKLAEVL